MVKTYNTASGIVIPEDAVVELDKNNLVTVWNSKVLAKYYGRKVSKFEEKTSHIFYDTIFGNFILQPLFVLTVAGGIGIGLLYLINLIF